MNFTGKVKNATAKEGNVNIVKNTDGFQLVFDAFNGQTLTVQYE